MSKKRRVTNFIGDIPKCKATKMKDPIVEEVRQHRLEHMRKFKGELTAICADLRSIQNASGHKVVRPAPRKLIQKKLSDKDTV